MRGASKRGQYLFYCVKNCHFIYVHRIASVTRLTTLRVGQIFNHLSWESSSNYVYTLSSQWGGQASEGAQFNFNDSKLYYTLCPERPNLKTSQEPSSSLSPKPLSAQRTAAECKWYQAPLVSRVVLLMVTAPPELMALQNINHESPSPSAWPSKALHLTVALLKRESRNIFCRYSYFIHSASQVKGMFKLCFCLNICLARNPMSEWNGRLPSKSFLASFCIFCNSSPFFRRLESEVELRKTDENSDCGMEGKFSLVYLVDVTSIFIRI